MTRNRRIATLSLVLSGALLASACGGGGGFEEEACIERAGVRQRPGRPQDAHRLLG